MCEPALSINQYNDDDGPGDATIQQILDKARAGAVKWGKRVRGWFNFCKMGNGHSEALEIRMGRGSWHMPDPTTYEGYWWNRSFKLDSWRIRPDELQPDQFEAAKEYADEVCLGSMQRLRRFLETSIMATTWPEAYYSRFMEGLLNSKGRHELRRKLRSIVKVGPVNMTLLDMRQRKSAVDAMVGITRKRRLLVPEWADDDSLWTPPKKKLVLPNPES